MLQAAGPDAVGTFFVFLHLLKRHTERLSELLLGHSLQPFEEPNNFLFAAGRFKPQAAARAMWVSLLFTARADPQSPITFAVCVSPSPTPPRARGVTPEAWRSLCALRAHVVLSF